MQAYTYNCNLKPPSLLQKGQVVALTQGQGHHPHGKEGVANIREIYRGKKIIDNDG